MFHLNPTLLSEELGNSLEISLKSREEVLSLNLPLENILANSCGRVVEAGFTIQFLEGFKKSSYTLAFFKFNFLVGIFMGKYRSRFDIIADILEAASESGLKKTNIMFRANLSYKLLCRYLNDLLEAEFLVNTKEGSFSVFRVTDKGKKFLEVFYDWSLKKERMREALEESRNCKEITMKLLNSRSNE